VRKVQVAKRSKICFGKCLKHHVSELPEITPPRPSWNREKRVSDSTRTEWATLGIQTREDAKQKVL
jgi:hypothetical protein